jgi:hypothetical protein
MISEQEGKMILDKTRQIVEQLSPNIRFITFLYDEDGAMLYGYGCKGCSVARMIEYIAFVPEAFEHNDHITKES